MPLDTVVKLFTPVLVLDILSLDIHIALKKTVTSKLSSNDNSREFDNEFFIKKGNDGNLHLPLEHKYHT